ncbi:MAG TPA: amino acid adenylation domain-containing protein [Solirubrobacteraceae bacterium]|nr:amino acid adenylation domain-containing protein [Solirubrobacteraceae bacterium]
MEPALLHERVALSAHARPSARAVVMGSQALTYEELEGMSNQLARLLLERGLTRGDRVALLQPKAPMAIVSMLATLKAGGVYVPLDIASPAVRVQKILASAEPRMVLACAKASKLADELDLASTELGSVEGTLERAAFGPRTLSGFDAGPLTSTTGPADPAHILFTSGSTGTPKGVVITHAMVSAFLDWALEYFGHQPGERISGHPPLHFDLSTFDIYGTLSSGAELHLVPPGTLLPAQLARFIRDSELTQWFSVPSTFAYMVSGDAIEEGDFASLRRVIWCGEVLAPAVLAHWMARVPQATYTNLYGPTEATIASSFHTVTSAPLDTSAPIPIGAPCAGEDIKVLDEQLGSVAPGEIGELYIEGAGLSPGYWREEEKTAAAFITHPESGARLYRTGDLGRADEHAVLHYVGRVDSQIKSRGYRIELGEIETALSAVDGVAECAVVAVQSDGFEGASICCAWAPRVGAQLDRLKLRGALAETLPSYMLPTQWLELESLPRNVSGKADRRLLKERFAALSNDE